MLMDSRTPAEPLLDEAPPPQPPRRVSSLSEIAESIFSHLPSPHRRRTRTSGAGASPKLGTLAVLAVVFFNVSGGPLGSEQLIAYGGPGFGLCALVGFAALFSLPQALVTAELSSAFPDNGGYSLWVQAAFGDFWAVQESYWSWFSGVVDSALYPVLLYTSATHLIGGLPLNSGAAEGNATAALSLASLGKGDFPDEARATLWSCLGDEDKSCGAEYLYRLLLLLAFTAPNCLSSALVGRGLVGLGLFVMSPYLALVVAALPRARPANFRLRPTKFKPAAMVSVAYWSLSGFDSVSTFAGEVEAPHRTLPRALLCGCLLMVVCYVLPLTAGVLADEEWAHWKDGSLTHVAQLVGGRWLGGWVLASSALSNWGLFSSELLEDSFQLLGMAEAGLAPRFFAVRHPRLGTPLLAILFQLVILSALIGFDFESIMCIDNFFSAAAATLEFAAAVQLRRRRPAMSRPFRIPCGTAGVAALVALPIVIALFVCVSTAMETRATLTIIVVGLAFGLLLSLPLWLRSGAAEAEGAEPAAPSEEGGEQGAAGDSCAPRVNSPPRAIS